MRIFLAGASGVIGRHLLPLLIGAGHEVAGLTRSPGKVDDLAATGAMPFVADVYDAAALTSAVTAFAPDVVVHELTDLPDVTEDLAAFADRNARIRIEGTDNLLAAARAAGASRFVAQSIAWTSPASAAAVEHLEAAVLAFDGPRGGVVIRYGQFYGPGTYSLGDPPQAPRIAIDEAARRTLPALTMPPGIITVTDD